MDSSFKAGILEISSTKFDSKSVEDVELQSMDSNSSRMIPNTKDIGNGTSIPDQRFSGG